ncbi:MAG: type II secretion system protein [Myxococcales bacterium]|nr:type II secretion system protein [Myxococcales bacterium]
MRASRRGFTLLEVLVATAILGLGLTAILSAQFSAVSGVAHARHMSVAIGLARCKMAEIEQQMKIDGFPEVGFDGSGPCCEDDETPNVTCSWVVERPTFPDLELGGLDLDTDLENTGLGNLASGAKTGDAAGSNIGDLASSLAGGDTGDAAAAAAGGVGSMMSMAMQLAYPALKPIFEASIRRVNLVVTWVEGDRSYDIEVVQWVTSPQPGLMPDVDALSQGASGTGTTGTTGTGTSGTRTPGGGQTRGTTGGAGRPTLKPGGGR